VFVQFTSRQFSAKELDVLLGDILRHVAVGSSGKSESSKKPSPESIGESSKVRCHYQSLDFAKLDML
jgi:hypothetical protein